MYGYLHRWEMGTVNKKCASFTPYWGRNKSIRSSFLRILFSVGAISLSESQLNHDTMSTFRSTLFFFLLTLLVCENNGFNPFKDSTEVDYSSSVYETRKLARQEQKLIKFLIKYKESLEDRLELLYEWNFTFAKLKKHRG